VGGTTTTAAPRSVGNRPIRSDRAPSGGINAIATRLAIVIAAQGGFMGAVSVCVATATFSTLSAREHADGISFFNLLRKISID
jgi:hypothetical protein